MSQFTEIRNESAEADKLSSSPSPTCVPDSMRLSSRSASHIPSPNAASAQVYRKVNVAIIGAGATGLSCASNLLQDSTLSPSLIVLEARDRIGGRIHTTQEAIPVTATNGTTNPQTKIISLDHGATWVHGISTTRKQSSGGDNNPSVIVKDDNPMVELLALGNSECPTTSRNPHPDHPFLTEVAKDGNPWTRPYHVLHKQNNIAIFFEGQNCCGESEEATTAEAICHHYKTIAELSDRLTELEEQGDKDDHVSLEHISLQSVMDSIHGEDSSSSNIVKAMSSFYMHLKECWHGTSRDALQAQEIMVDESNENIKSTIDEHYTPVGDFDGSHCTVPAGMQSLLTPLVEAVGTDRIHLNHEVVSIQHESDYIQIETENGMIIKADCCVTTLPVGYLKANANRIFQPALPSDKLEALSRLYSGSYKKILLTFDSIFWPINESIIGMIRNEKNDQNGGIGSNLLFYNLWAKDDIPCIEAVLFGAAGEWATHRSDEELKTAIIDFMQVALKQDNLHDKCLGCHVTRWEEDPYTLGSYTSFQLGTTEKDVEILARPEWGGRLIFAGEATNVEAMGSVHSALMSGAKTAEMAVSLVASKLRKGTPPTSSSATPPAELLIAA